MKRAPNLPPRLRRLLTRITTPLLPDDYTRLVNPLWTAREIRGRILAATPGPDHTTNLTIEPGWGLNPTFTPGQYIGIGIALNGRFTWRSYSLTSAGTSSGGSRRELSVTVKEVDGGQLSGHLTHARPGMIVRLAQPAGEFILPTPTPSRLVFIAAGSGITPIIAMLRHLAGAQPYPTIDVIYSVRTRQDVLFPEDLDRAAELGARMHIQVTSEKGRLAPRNVEGITGELAEDAHVFIAGSAEFTDAFREGLAGCGALVHTEAFTLPRTNTTTGGRVTFAQTAVGEPVVADSDGVTTILESAEGAGLSLPFGCRMGICQTCVQQIQEGYAQDLRTGETKGPGERVRTCVCVPAGDLTI